MGKSQHMWNEQKDALHRSFMFQTFSKAVNFVNDVAGVSEQHHHHPKITIDYTRVVLALNTHDAGNIVTDKDHLLAAAIDQVYQEYSL